MCAFPQINSVFVCENKALLQGKLRDEWGFKGFIQSDWGAAHSTVGSANAGMNLEMIDGTWYGEKMKQAVLAGQVTEQRVDELLLPRFRTMFAFGQFDHPPVLTPLPTAEHDAAAKQFAERGMVLLRNEHAQLPLDDRAVKSIALIGPFATRAKTGGGGSSAVIPTSTVDPLPGLRQRVPGAAGDARRRQRPGPRGGAGPHRRRQRRDGRGQRGRGQGPAEPRPRRQPGRARRRRSPRRTRTRWSW